MLETVHYSDEEPITYRSDRRDRAILEAAKHILGITIRELYPMVARMLIEGLDPIGGDGDVFEFGNFDVPLPNASVNLIEAAEVCGRHIKTCEMLLTGPIDRAKIVSLNSEKWLRFWAKRAPTAEIREAFNHSLNQLLEMRRTGLMEE